MPTASFKQLSFPSSIPVIKPHRDTFIPSKHLAYVPPRNCYTMEDLGYPADTGISPVAVTEPFPLFSPEGVRELRRDVLSKESLEKYNVSHKLASFQTREHPKEIAPFVHQAWKHPSTLAAISEAAGIELVPIMDMELGHTNYQVQGDNLKEDVHALRPEPTEAPPLDFDKLAEAQAAADADFGDGNTTVGEHRDSYPFVCVVMLSDVKNMVGGETGLRCADGSMLKARGPGIGSAVMLQGRYVSHIALKAYNTPERISMVCSFRAKDPMVEDSSVLTTIRLMSKYNRCCYYWSTYRLRLMSERFAMMADQIEARRAELGVDNDSDGKGGADVVNLPSLEKWVDQQIGYLQTTIGEMKWT